MAPFIHNDPVLSSDSTSGSASGLSTPPGQYESRNPEPIAIVGMGCRLPGDVSSPTDLWNLLIQERSGQGNVPASRWNIDSFYHPNVERPGSMNTKGGYFLQGDIREFDNSFFGINNLEATYMDPQQRKLLEVCYECFESAGVPIESVSGANIACYVGNFTTDFLQISGKNSDNFHRYSATGMGTTILSNRISHVFNLKGPSVALDTACSSSLYAVHMACQSIDAGECDGAIAAAANLIQSPEQHLGTMRAGVLSGTSTCHTFDSSADGYGRADGIGAVYLKKLSKALADNDPIRAVIRGSAVNANGKTNGITLPSADGQEAVIRKAYAKAGSDCSLGETAYVECHGTGTAVGDPIEVEAVSRVFKKNADGPLLIGSVKTNLGHSEAASGFSSIIKVAMALEKGVVPPTIGVTSINPKIKTDEWGVQIVTKQQQWPEKAPGFLKKPVKRAGINSFGYGGANSHIILEAFEPLARDSLQAASADLALQRLTFILPMTGNSAASLEAQIHSLSAAELSGTNVVDLAFTLGSRRSMLDHRAFTLAGQKTLRADLASDKFSGMTKSIYRKHPLAFVFTGQGAQWAQMGLELIEEFPSFRKTIEELDAVLQSLPEAPVWTLREAIGASKDESQISHVTRSQPVCTALQIAYVELLSRWGIRPAAVIGHSSGEIGAAFATGLLTAAQAIITAYYRGYCVDTTTNLIPGAMMAAGLGLQEAQATIDNNGLTGKIKVACINSPESVTVSGDADGIDELLAQLQTKGTFARKLNTNGRAYHSHHMGLVGPTYAKFLETRLPPSPGKLRPAAVWISSVTGEEVEAVVPPAYWRANLESPVRFSEAAEKLCSTSTYHMVEIGPHSALEMPLKQTRASLNISLEDSPYTAALIRGKNATTCVLNAVGDLWMHGHTLDFAKVNFVESAVDKHSSIHMPLKQGKVITDLPPYQWTYDAPLWAECRLSNEYRNRQYPYHDLLGIQFPGGDGMHSIWRNLLKVENVPWLQDHKLDDTVVFPGAGYIAMALEAVRQVTGTDLQSAPSFDLRHIQILKALVLPGIESKSDGVELFTSLVPMALSGTSKSKRWFEFEINSFKDGTSTVHAAGAVAIGKTNPDYEAHTLRNTVDTETLAIRNWYGQFAKVGLNFGPAFNSLQRISTPRSKTGRYAIGETQLLRGGGTGKQTQSEYVVHPITIDALLQSGIIASTSGVIQDLGPNVPVAIEEAFFQTPHPEFAKTLFVDASAEKVGFSNNLISASLRDESGHVIGHLKNAHSASYQGAAKVEDEEAREPMLRVVWKADADLLTNASFSRFLEIGHKTDVDRLAAALDLLSHKTPTCRIVEIASSSEPTREFLDTLKAQSPFRRFKSYATGHFSSDADLILSSLELKPTGNEMKAINGSIHDQYDIVVVSAGLQQPEQNLVLELLSETGALVFTGENMSDLTENMRAVVGKSDGCKSVTIAHKHDSESQDVGAAKKGGLLLVEDDSNPAFNDALLTMLATREDIQRISLASLRKDMIQAKTTVICTIELTRPVMSTLTPEESEMVKVMTDNAHHIIWITGGNSQKGARPDFALISGLSRALMLEQPALKFRTLDLDSSAQTAETMQGISDLIGASHRGAVTDFEFVLTEGTFQVSRMVAEETMNAVFRDKQGKVSVQKALGEAMPAQLTIGTVGQYDTITFKQIDPDISELAPGHVEVDVKSVGLNAKDFYALAGKVETKDAGCKLECAGVVTGVAKDNIERLAVGDRVVVLLPGQFLTTERFPEWACQKLEDGEDYNVVCTLPVVYATALYALHHRAHIREGESVLVHSAAGGLGIAAIQIAQLANADIYATVGTEAKKEFLVKEFGLRRDHIFSSRDSSFLPAIMEATAGRGIDIVLNSLTGDLLHDSWAACAQFGRFIEVGKRDIVDAGKLDMAVFERNVTFSAFDLSYLCNNEEPKLYKVLSGLVAETMSLYRQRKIRAVEPLKVFDVSELSTAYRYFGLGNRIGKVSIDMSNPKSMIPTLPSKFDSTFDTDKTYLMIGCLGGLGRSYSKWLMSRGARKFVFLGRSGTDKAPARQLVDDLQIAGAEVLVVRGDVTDYEAVQKAVDLIEGPIGGVVQAAMGLHEALWTAMSNEHWHTGIDPKVIGSWNLYNALAGRTSDLHFFLMTSSVSGSVGTATEGNYCAANYFLDVFARFLRSKGLPGVSIGLGMISEVGYLHENPEIEAILLRKGIQAINEDELLQITDIALAHQNTPTPGDSEATSHILTGLEPLGMKRLRKAGFSGTNPTMNDPRASIMASALDSDADADLKKNSGLPAELAAAIASGADRNTTVKAALASILARFSNLVLLQIDKIDTNRSLSAFGMDSMLAAEFRTWFYQAFEVDVPFLTLLAESTTLKALGELVCDRVVEQ